MNELDDLKKKILLEQATFPVGSPWYMALDWVLARIKEAEEQRERENEALDHLMWD